MTGRGAGQGEQDSIDQLRAELATLRRRCAELEQRGGGRTPPGESADRSAGGDLRVGSDAILITRLSDNVILEVSDEFCGHTGYRPEEVRGRTAADLDIWVDLDDRRRILATVEGEGRIDNLPTRFRHRDGRVQPYLVTVCRIDLAAAPCVLWLTRNMEAVRSTQEAVRTGQRRYRDLYENLPDGVVSTDLAGHFISCNAAYEQMLGYTLDELRQLTYEELTPARWHAWEAQLVQDRVLGQGRSGRYEKEYRRKDGTVFPVELTAYLMRNEQGQPVGMWGIARDITARKQAEVEREQLIAELEAKNAELERFTYTVSHDLRTPLITINGFVTSLAEDAAAGDLEAVQTDMGFIREATARMEQLLDDLLELSRIGRLVNPSEWTSLRDIVAEATRSLALALEKASVELVQVNDGLKLYGDTMRLVEVVENLLSNAVKYMGDQPHPRIEIGVRRRDGQDIVYVADNGIGIDPQYHERVFNLFERLDSRGDGAGVGLTIVKRIVELHGGRVWVESDGTPGQGCTVCFTLGRPDDAAVGAS